MYPQRELKRLEAYQSALCRDIAIRRTQCAEAASKVAQPLDWLDRVVAFWRRVPPLAKFATLPLGLVVQRALFPRWKVLGQVVRWSPLILSTFRGLGAAKRAHSASTRSSNSWG